MPRDGKLTKAKILDVTYDLILEEGLGGASIDQIVEKAGVTKGSFFYHFKGKDELLDALLDRFAQMDRQQYFDTIDRVNRMSGSDPLQRLLLFVGIFIDQFSDLETPYPGCLYAAYLYQQGAVTQSSMTVAKDSMLFWREKLAAMIQEAITDNSPETAVNPNSLADLFTTVIEGSFILAKTLNEPAIVADHLKHYQSYLEKLLAPRK